MAGRSEKGSDAETRDASALGAGGRRIVGWVLGFAGAAAVFFGLFILFAGEDQYLGMGGARWRVGDIPRDWAFGLLAGGGLLLTIVIALAVRGGRRSRA